jgi:hypothetical protein
MQRNFYSKGEGESDSERLRRRLQERRERLEHNTRPRINPFTLLSIIIILVVMVLLRN